MGMYYIGVILAFSLALLGMYKKRETIFKDENDKVLAVTLIVITFSSWLYVGHFLFIMLDRLTERAEKKQKDEEGGS